jgi:hypothetical protein
MMDYSGGNDLVKYQWNILHDTGIAGWLDDTDESESVANTNLNVDGTETIDRNLVAFISSDLKMPAIKGD